MPSLKWFLRSVEVFEGDEIRPDLRRAVPYGAFFWEPIDNTDEDLGPGFRVGLRYWYAELREDDDAVQ
jgi:hypothetical protein